MSTDIDELIGAEVERSFDAEPPLPDPRAYAAHGRRARRRRRTAIGTVGVASVTVVAILAIGGADLGDRPGRSVEPAGTGVVPVRVTAPVPVDPHTAAECADRSISLCGPEIGWDDLRPDAAGRLIRGYADVEVTGHYEHVLAGYPYSAALEVRRHGRTAWALVTSNGDPASTDLSLAPPDPHRTFDQWVLDSVAAGRWFSYDEALPR